MSKTNSGKGNNHPATVLQSGESALTVPDTDTNTSTSDAAPGSLAQLQQQMDSPQAMHRPVQISQRDEAIEPLVPSQTLDMPGTGDLSRMKRDDLVIESIEPISTAGHAGELEFLNELVIINIADSADPTAENPVFLSINGRAVYVKRGEDTVLRRMYVEQLLRAKPINVRTQVSRNGDGDAVNKITKTHAMKYPFSVVRDDNPLGRAWMRKILSEG